MVPISIKKLHKDWGRCVANWDNRKTPKGKFESRNKAAKAYKVTTGKIQWYMKYFGSKFYFTKDGPGKDKPYNPPKKVVRFKGRRYSSMSEAARATGVHISTVSKYGKFN